MGAVKRAIGALDGVAPEAAGLEAEGAGTEGVDAATMEKVTVTVDVTRPLPRVRLCDLAVTVCVP